MRKLNIKLKSGIELVYSIKFEEIDSILTRFKNEILKYEISDKTGGKIFGSKNT